MGDWGEEIGKMLIVLAVASFVIGGATALCLYWLFHHLNLSVGWR